MFLLLHLFKIVSSVGFSCNLFSSPPRIFIFKALFCSIQFLIIAIGLAKKRQILFSSELNTTLTQYFFFFIFALMGHLTDLAKVSPPKAYQVDQLSAPGDAETCRQKTSSFFCISLKYL